MPISVRLSALLLGATLLAGGGPTAAWAQAAGTGGRCEGTLCDYYYGNTPPGPTSATAASPSNGSVPLAVPSLPSSNFLGKFFSGGGGTTQPAQPGAAAAPSNSMLQVQGGGLVGKVTGAPPPSRCEGTLCDFYYGGAPPPRPVEQTARPTGVTAAATPEPAADDIAPAAPRRRAVVEKPRCVSPANDPWRCYR